MKYLNTKGIIVLIVILLVVQIASGLFISPLVSQIVISQINKYSDAKISAGRISVWPLTLSASLRDLKIFDPDDPNKQMIGIKKASIRLSPIGLLRKRLAISAIKVSDADINLKSEPDGSFNIQKIAGGEEEEKARPSILERFRGKGDWFSRVFAMVKKRSSKQTAAGKTPEEKAAPKITKEVKELPRGRRVKFVPAGGGYLLEVGSLSVKGANIRVEADGGRTIDVKRGSVLMRGMGIDPKKGARFDKFAVSGKLEKEGKSAGDFSISYAQKGNKTVAKVVADDIDLPAISFVYETSLPVQVNKGILDLNSNTTIVENKLDSKNSLTLKGQDLQPKRGAPSIGAVTTPVICQALNQIDPVRLNFNITGTPENPKFTGFQDSLMKLVKPYMEEGLKKEGESFLKGLTKKEEGASATKEGEGTQKTLDSIKDLFKK
jgi:hypothetical protein